MEEEQTDSQEIPESSTGQSIEETAEESQVQDSPPEQSADVATADITPPLEPQPELKIGEGEDNVNWRNQYYAQQRQLEKTNEQLNAVVERLDKNQGQKTGEYSIEELEAFAETTDNVAHRAWAKGEIRKAQKEEVASGIRNEINKWKSEQQAEASKSEAFQTVVSRYPEAFKKNAQGQVVGWDPNSPMAQRVGQYMQDPELKNNPRGLLVASALAYSDVAANVTHKAAVVTTKAKAEVKNLQKKTLTEGGGVSSPPASKTPVSAAKEKFASTGSTKDGAAAFKEILKLRGRISED